MKSANPHGLISRFPMIAWSVDLAYELLWFDARHRFHFGNLLRKRIDTNSSGYRR
jgi:hypothetical protein